jgi:hypothetical protein
MSKIETSEILFPTEEEYHQWYNLGKVFFHYEHEIMGQQL